MIKTVLETIKKYNMFNNGDKVIVAVSGGPDSICLLHILHSLRKKFDIKLYAAHVNHCLRGDDSDQDEEYVKSICRNLDIELRCKSVNINEICKEKNISCESAGRQARYDFFENFKKEIGAQKIAIAHNANDQAETILMRIMRGAGLEGLIGIKPIRDNIFVRPLIDTTRDQIEEYCKIENLNPRIDKTNLQTIYTRNKIRLELLPYIQKNFNKDIIKVLNRLSDTIKIDNEYLDTVAKEKFKKYCDIHREKVIISREAFFEDQAIITRIIRIALNIITGTLKNFEKVHIYDIINMQSKSTGKEIDIANGVRASNIYGNICISLKTDDIMKNNIHEYTLHMGINYINDYKLKLVIRIIDKEEKVCFSKNKLIKYFDYDKIKCTITMRYRKDGDKFIPLGMKGNKKLKDFFIDEKIPKSKRERVPLICFDNNIAWIVGYRVSELFRVDENTRNILEIKIEGEET